MDAPAESRQAAHSSLSGAAATGLALGLLVSAAYMLFQSFKERTTSCDGLSPAECAIELESARYLSMIQGFAGVALALLAAALALMIRAQLIGIGGSGSSATPLPHHRTCGSASGGSVG